MKYLKPLLITLASVSLLSCSGARSPKIFDEYRCGDPDDVRSPITTGENLLKMQEHQEEAGLIIVFSEGGAIIYNIEPDTLVYCYACLLYTSPSPRDRG